MATPDAVTIAVNEIARQLRTFGFKGRVPNLEHEVDDGTLHLVHFQRVNAGVTGREPGFTVNLNVVHGALRRAWQHVGHWQSQGHIRSGLDTGVATRLGILAFERDHWWHPSTEEEAHAAAREVLDLIRSHGLPWLDGLTDPADAIGFLLAPDAGVTLLEAAAALLVERPDDDRRRRARTRLVDWSVRLGGDQKRLVDWLIDTLADSPAT